MKRIYIFLIVCTAALLVACSGNIEDLTVGSGKVITEQRKVSNFTSLELGCSADVILAQGGSLAVSIEGEDNILPKIETNVSGGKLSIEARSNSNFRATQKLIVHITVPALSAIRASGSGDVDINGLNAGGLNLDVSGSGNINIHYLKADKVTAVISGSGDITLDGKVDSQTVTISGSGSYESGLLESRLAVATISGSGDVIAWVTYSLLASISGSGDVKYYGTAGLTQKTSGSGSVENLGDRP